MRKVAVLALAGAFAAAGAAAQGMGDCRHAAMMQMTAGEWRSVFTARARDGTVKTQERPFRARETRPGVLELSDPTSGAMFLRMRRTADRYSYEEPGPDGKPMAGVKRVINCGAPNAQGYQAIAETSEERAENGSPIDALTNIVAGPGAIIVTGSQRPRGSSAPFAWANTMSVIRVKP